MNWVLDLKEIFLILFGGLLTFTSTIILQKTIFKHDLLRIDKEQENRIKYFIYEKEKNQIYEAYQSLYSMLLLYRWQLLRSRQIYLALFQLQDAKRTGKEFSNEKMMDIIENLPSDVKMQFYQKVTLFKLEWMLDLMKKVYDTERIKAEQIEKITLENCARYSLYTKTSIIDDLADIQEKMHLFRSDFSNNDTEKWVEEIKIMMKNVRDSINQEFKSK